MTCVEEVRFFAAQEYNSWRVCERKKKEQDIDGSTGHLRLTSLLRTPSLRDVLQMLSVEKNWGRTAIRKDYPKGRHKTEM